MPVQIHRYTLRSRGSLNAVSQRREFHGALIKVNDGIGCLHPWPEFGDAPVEEQLKLLREGGTSKVIERALRMAELDGDARRRGVSLFHGIEIPPSHFSWDQNQPAEPQMTQIIEEGWQAIKTKGAKRFEETLALLNTLFELAANAPPKLRIDFNSCLTAAQFADLINQIPSYIRDSLDFIEDPFPYEAGAWSAAQRDLGVRLACDKGLMQKEDTHTGESGYEVAVLKPGRREWRTMIDGLPPQVRIVLTSAMDHAIGQSFAAYEAATAWRGLGERMELCGLCTQHLFAEDEFFARISDNGGKLEVDRAGTGLGFDEVIKALPWSKL